VTTTLLVVILSDFMYIEWIS